MIVISRCFLKLVMKNIYDAIHKKLQKSLSFCLISDKWTSIQMLNFMGLAPCYTNEWFQKDLIIIGMDLMPDADTSENIKKAIESLVNRYNFDKSLIHCKVYY